VVKRENSRMKRLLNIPLTVLFVIICMIFRVEEFRIR